MIQRPIPVICDCCRARGVSGEDPFEAFGALLDFEPVPRKANRADGWTPDVQRAFIAALSLTGSDRAAARAVGKAQFGVTQLLACPGSEGFAAARAEAMEIAADERSRRLAEGLRAVAEEQAGWRPPDPPYARATTRARPAAPAPAEPSASLDFEADEDAHWDAFCSVATKYHIKLEAERRCRLEGRIAEADFYLRQLTFVEILVDLTTDRRAFAWLRDFRHGTRHIVQIAQTSMSMLLDKLRRLHWEQSGAPPRPAATPPHLLVDHGDFATGAMQSLRGTTAAEMRAERAAWEEQYRRDAEAQIAWEASAAAEFEARRAAGLVPPPLPPEPDAWDEVMARLGAAAEPATDPNPEPPIPNPGDGEEQ